MAVQAMGHKSQLWQSIFMQSAEMTFKDYPRSLKVTQFSRLLTISCQWSTVNLALFHIGSNIWPDTGTESFSYTQLYLILPLTAANPAISELGTSVFIMQKNNDWWAYGLMKSLTTCTVTVQPFSHNTEYRQTDGQKCYSKDMRELCWHVIIRINCMLTDYEQHSHVFLFLILAWLINCICLIQCCITRQRGIHQTEV